MQLLGLTEVAPRHISLQGTGASCGREALMGGGRLPMALQAIVVWGWGQGQPAGTSLWLKSPAPALDHSQKRCRRAVGSAAKSVRKGEVPSPRQISVPRQCITPRDAAGKLWC